MPSTPLNVDGTEDRLGVGRYKTLLAMSSTRLRPNAWR